MKFKSIADQQKYYSENIVEDTACYSLIKEQMGHFLILNNLESFSNALSDCDNNSLPEVYEYFKNTTNNICLFKIFNKIISLNEIHNATCAKKIIKNYNVDEFSIRNSSLNVIQKNSLLFYGNKELDLNTPINIDDLIPFLDDLDFISKIIDLSPLFYTSNIKSFNLDSKEIILNYLEKFSLEEKFIAIKQINTDSNIKGFFTLNNKEFVFNFNDIYQQIAFNDFKLKTIIDMTSPALALELELVSDSNNVEIAAQLNLKANAIYAELADNEESFIFSAKDNFIYGMSELVTKTMKVLSNPYTKLAIAGIVIGSGLLHSESALAGDNHHHTVGHLSESEVSNIMGQTPYLNKMKSLMFGNFGHATQAGVDALHQKALWKSVEAQFDKLGIDINELQAKHFNKISISNRFSWTSTDSGYEFHGGGYRAIFKLDHNNYTLNMYDSGTSEIISKSAFESWSQKILNHLNEAHHIINKK